MFSNEGFIVQVAKDYLRAGLSDAFGVLFATHHAGDLVALGDK